MKPRISALCSLIVATSLLLTPLFGGAAPALAFEPSQSTTAPAAPSSGMLRFPILGEPATLDPAQMTYSGSATSVLVQIFEGLARYDQHQNAIPAIAATWSTPDAQTWTFNLRHDVMFHNGRQVKANDFVYSWGRAKAAGGDYASLYDDISTFAAPDDFTFVVTLTAPSANFPIKIALPIFAVIPFEAAGAIGTNPVGAGPFKFVSWTPGDKIVLARFAGYYDSPARLAGVELRFIADAGVQWTEFQAGNLDVTLVPADHWSEVEADPNALSDTNMLTYGYGIDMTAFPDVRVRQALQAAIDRAAIISDPVIGGGLLRLAHGVVSPGKGSYDNSDIVISYDPQAALALLAAAGWQDTNGDGVLDNGEGADLRVVVHDTTGIAGHAMALRVAENLADVGGGGVGASVTMTTTPAANLLRLGWGSDYPDPDDDLLPYETNGIFASRFHYSSAAFDGFLADARATLDESERNATFHAAEVQLVLTEAAALPIYHTTTQVLKSSDVRGLHLTEFGYANIQLRYAWLDSNYPYNIHLPLVLR